VTGIFLILALDRQLHHFISDVIWCGSAKSERFGEYVSDCCIPSLPVSRGTIFPYSYGMDGRNGNFVLGSFDQKPDNLVLTRQFLRCAPIYPTLCNFDRCVALIVEDTCIRACPNKHLDNIEMSILRGMV
jgi:hypothetical protein